MIYTKISFKVDTKATGTPKSVTPKNWFDIFIVENNKLHIHVKFWVNWILRSEVIKEKEKYLSLANF